jgi:hypothetical protein
MSTEVQSLSLCGTGRVNYRSDLGLLKIRIFFTEGLDFDLVDARLICPSGSRVTLEPQGELTLYPPLPPQRSDHSDAISEMKASRMITAP